jgi:ABC-type dipeptide/oligopeptide/nickel transport system ATPase component
LLENSANIKASAILFEGNNILKASKKELRNLRKNRIGIVFQDPIASWNLSRKVGTQLLDAFDKSERAERREKLISYMEKVGIDKAAQVIDMYPYMLSGGMMQRAMIAGALLGNPVLLIADEPTSALDAETEHEIMKVVNQLKGEATVFIVAHRLSTIRSVDKVLYVDGGRIAGVGTFDELRSSLPQFARQVELGLLIVD